MAYAEDIQRPVISPIVLVEIDIPLSNDLWINYEAGIWHINLRPDGNTFTGSDGLVGYYEGRGEKYYNVRSMQVDGTFYNETTTIANLRATDSSFYFEYSTQKLYVHIEDCGYPQGKTILLGASDGFCNRVDTVNGCYYRGEYYEPRVDSIPQLTKSKDPLYFGMISYQGGTIKLNNADGFFDEYNNQVIYGQPIRVMLGFNGYEYDDFEQVYEGFIESSKHDYDSFDVMFNDQRKRLSRNIPVNALSQEDYPNLIDDNIDKVKPMAFGKVRGAPTICLDENGAGPYTFLFMDTDDYAATALDAVYVDGIEVSPSSTTLSDGIFTLSAGVCKDGDSLLDVTCDFHGASIVNGLEIIEYINTTFSNIAYTSDNYNLSEWIYEKSIALDVGLYIGERTEISDIIGQICVAENGIMFQQDNGLWTFRTFRDDREPVGTIYADEWINDPEIETEIEQLLSSVVIKFDQDLTTGEFLNHINTDYEQQVYDKYRMYKEETFETMLTTRLNADAKAEAIMMRSKDIYPTVTRKTAHQNFSIEIMDFIICEHERPYIHSEIKDKPWSIWEVLSITKNLDDYSTTLKMQKVADYTWEDETSVQGVLYFANMFNHKMYGYTDYYRS